MKYFSLNSSVFKILIAISVIFLLSSANTLYAIGGKKLFETFYVGEDGIQYFIKPIKFYGKNTKEGLVIDVTFRYKDQIKDSVQMNMTFSTKDLVKKPDSVVIENNMVRAVCKNGSLLYAERKSDLFDSRFSVKYLLADLNAMFGNNEWTITLYKNGNNSAFSPGKKSKKKLTRLNNELFIMLR